jgi:branched-chain amino acid transport system ATP-binding protein/nonpolar-amino-acid-transporting ATPase
MLTVQSVHAGYGHVPVLRDISLQVGSAEAVAIVGANGAGKTTLVRAICGLGRATAGTIIKDGVDITAVPPYRMVEQGLAVVLETRGLFPELTIRENLRLAERAGRKARKGAGLFSWAEVCRLFPIIEERLDTPTELLSGGQQQMVAIARSLLLQPDLLVMDEPSTGLAPKVVLDILKVMEGLRSQGMSLLLVEQNVGIAAAITERAYVMAVGQIVHEVRAGEWQAFLSDERLTKAYLGS